MPAEVYDVSKKDWVRAPATTAPANFATAQVTVANTATLLAAARGTRRTITIINLGSTDVYIGGSGVTTANGVILVGAKGVGLTIQSADAIYGIVASGTQAVSLLEEFD